MENSAGAWINGLGLPVHADKGNIHPRFGIFGVTLITLKFKSITATDSMRGIYFFNLIVRTKRGNGTEWLRNETNAKISDCQALKQ